MYEDEPQDKVHDVLGEAVFGDHPLGRPIIGTRRRHRAAPVPTSPPTTTARYAPRNIVVAAAGIVDHERSSSSSQRARRPRAAAARAGAARGARAQLARRALLRQGDRAVPPLPRRARASPRDDDRRFALRVLDTILGGTVVLAAVPGGAREARPGLLASTPTRRQYAGTGQIGLYVGTRPDNVAEAHATSSATSSAHRCDEPVTEEELERAKENVKGRVRARRSSRRPRA